MGELKEGVVFGGIFKGLKSEKLSLVLEGGFNVNPKACTHTHPQEHKGYRSRLWIRGGIQMNQRVAMRYKQKENN